MKHVTGHLTVTRIPSRVLGRRLLPFTTSELHELRMKGNAYDVDAGANLITDLGLSALRCAFGGGANSPVVSNGVQVYPVTSLAGLAVSQMKLGNIASPTLPAVSDFQRQTAPVTYTITAISVTYPDLTSVSIGGLVPAETLVGTTFTEEGLFIAAGAMIARRTITPVTQIPGFGLQFTHRLGPFVVTT
jgi:hypothetical protein